MLCWLDVIKGWYFLSQSASYLCFHSSCKLSEEENVIFAFVGVAFSLNCVGLNWFSVCFCELLFTVLHFRVVLSCLCRALLWSYAFKSSFPFSWNLLLQLNTFMVTSFFLLPLRKKKKKESKNKMILGRNFWKPVYNFEVNVCLLWFRLRVWLDCPVHFYMACTRLLHSVIHLSVECLSDIQSLRN